MLTCPAPSSHLGKDDALLETLPTVKEASDYIYQANLFRPESGNVDKKWTLAWQFTGPMFMATMSEKTKQQSKVSEKGCLAVKAVQMAQAVQAVEAAVNAAQATHAVQASKGIQGPVLKSHLVVYSSASDR